MLPLKGYLLIMSKIAVIIPVFNEELTIRNVIIDFYSQLSKLQYDYKIYIINNNSNDNTDIIANQVINDLNIPAKIIFVGRQGKANAVKEAFRSIDADVYIMADGDSTYWAEDLENLILPILNNNVDMVIGDRISSGAYGEENKRSFHGFGNFLVKWLINSLFKSKLNDIMTGYRGFSNRMIKNYPIICEGFELETDMTIFCLEHKLNIVEVPIKFTDRPEGSFSKLDTYRDGFRVVKTIFNLFRNYKPMKFFGIVGLIFFIFGLVLGFFPVSEYIEYHYIYKVPTAILSVGMVISSFLSWSIALILDVNRRYQNLSFELNMLNYYNKKT